MIKHIKTFLFFIILFLLIFPKSALAIENPLSTPNNKFGIHILFPEEINDAAKLVNSNGGEWGYVTIPIQAKEKDLEKWQKFMDDAKKLHLIPLIRLSTEGDYFNTKVWRKPNFEDILDFANFLDSLNWPIKNRYVIVFNEVNRDDEWEGELNPREYAEILSYAVTVFKSKNQNFFIISSGLDNGAGNSFSSMNQYDFLVQMNNTIPDIFSQIDGLASHSYPNPAFSQPPFIKTNKSITSFLYEKSLVESFTQKDLPIFITETGWSRERIGENQAAEYFKEAFEVVWDNEKVVAVTPFLLRANAGPFINFSFLNTNNIPNEIYKTVFKMQKIKGKPKLVKDILGRKVPKILQNNVLPEKKFTFSRDSNNDAFSADVFKKIFKWLLKI